MRLELSHIRQPETELHKVFQPADLAGEDEEYRVTAPVDLRMTIHKDHDRFRLIGAVKTELELACSRCLEPFVMPVDREFDLRYLPAGAAEPEMDDEKESEVEDDDECGEEIAQPRLRALPFAVRCKDCEEAREMAQQRERIQARRGSATLGFDMRG